MGVCIWLVLDAADDAAAAEDGSTAATIEKGMPPLAASARLRYDGHRPAPGWAGGPGGAGAAAITFCAVQAA